MNHAAGRSKRLKPLLIVVLVAAVLAVIGYGYASPYVALGRLKAAIDARDAQAVSEYVDFPALRTSLKQQVTDELMHRIDAKWQDNNPFAVIGALIGSALIGPLVDAYATPEGVAALMSGIPPRGNPGERPPEWMARPSGSASGTQAASGATPPAGSVPAASPSTATDHAQAIPPERRPTSAGYRNIDEFVVTYQRNVDGARYAAIFHREGLFSWKLAAIDLHG
ncbi:DUF2939 domain-containing protein [Burkholderia sp. Bp8963]|uniref:DUF2939 domain-containing protein n=1 Tax=Burkholderia sp. Bp8963 TaxID=2184547 RepID=UPI000F5B0FE9|nr:DUF2939 domain-containing protein [Burkholderia sp. Bp8963]RQS75527.1 DUF2939 domain-containing protein [Burkholderia sp. Bp8963]